MLPSGYLQPGSQGYLKSKFKAGMAKTDKDRASLETAAPPLADRVDGDEALPASFEAALAELEAIVASMEAGELALEQSLSAYKRGASLLQYCQSALKDAQQQVKVLEAGMLQDLPGADDNG
jgi:exodeoxyribonuclease VII small subunit